MDVLETLQKLPLFCYTYNNCDGRLIAIKRGVMGYYPIESRRTAQELNEGRATPKQVMAMEVGSMFGWEVPGADPDYYTDEQAQAHADHLAELAQRVA